MNTNQIGAHASERKEGDVICRTTITEEQEQSLASDAAPTVQPAGAATHASKRVPEQSSDNMSPAAHASEPFPKNREEMKATHKAQHDALVSEFGKLAAGSAEKPEYSFTRDPNPNGECIFLCIPKFGDWDAGNEHMRSEVYGLSRTTALRLRDELEAALSPPNRPDMNL